MNYLGLNISEKCGRTIYPPASEASREVANLTEKKPYTPIYGVKEFVSLSVCGQL